MVHQLSLVSSIPHSSYIQTVSSLQALTGLLFPQPITTYTLLTRPHDVFKPKFEPGKVNQIEQYHMRCTTTWADTTSEELDIANPIIKSDKDHEILVDRLFVSDDTKKQWTLQISDIPNAGKNQGCSAQNIYESTLVHHHTKVVDIEKIQVEDKNNSTLDNKEDDVMVIDEPQVKKENEADDKEIKEIGTEANPETIEVDSSADTKPSESKHEPNESKPKPETNENEAISETEDNGETQNKETITDTKENPEAKDIDTKPNGSTPQENDKMEIDNPVVSENVIHSDESKNGIIKFKEVEVIKRKDSFLQFLEDLGYDVINQYWIKGIRFFHGDIVIEIFKIFIRDDSPSSNSEKLQLKLLDESNTFQIKAYINIPKSTDVDAVNQGTKDLLKLQDFFKNLFRLTIPDRMYMDSRITNRQI